MQSLKDFMEVVNILREHDIELWADLGALLGFTRENNLLEWEEDIDCGTLSEREDFKQVEEHLEKYEWKCFDKYKGISIQNKSCTTKIDIKFYKEEWDYVYAYFVVYKHKWVLPVCDFLIWNLKKYPSSYKYETKLPKPILKLGCFIIRKLPFKNFLIRKTERIYYHYGLTGHKIMFPRDWVLPLKGQKVNNFSFSVPAKPEKLLELTYGKNWKKPMKIIPGTDRYEDGSSRYLTVRVMEQRPDLVEVEK